jgi:hypothetical protein
LHSGKKHTRKYPTDHPETIIPIAVPTRSDPKVFPTTIGTVENQPPFATPFTIAKMSVGAKVVEAGQMTNRLNALRRRVRKSELRGPMASHK